MLSKRAQNTLALESLAGAESDMNKDIQAFEAATGNEICPQIQDIFLSAIVTPLQPFEI